MPLIQRFMNTFNLGKFTQHIVLFFVRTNFIKTLRILRINTKNKVDPEFQLVKKSF